jgi:hypothetical protein
MACLFNVFGCPGPGPFAACVGCKRKKFRFFETPEPYVNMGSTEGIFKLEGSLGSDVGSDSDKNCSLCTAAGAINLIMEKSVWTTKMVAGARGSLDGRTGMGESRLSSMFSGRAAPCGSESARARCSRGRAWR